MKIIAPLITVSPLVPENGELTKQNPAVTPGSDFSALLFLIVTPRHSIPVTDVAVQSSDEPIAEDSLAPSNSPSSGPLPALELPLSAPDVYKDGRPVWSIPATINSLASGAYTPINGTPIDVIEGSFSATVSPPTAAADFTNAYRESSGKISIDHQMVEPDESAALKPTGENPLGAQELESAAVDKPPSLPPNTHSGRDAFERSIEVAKLTHDEIQIGTLPGKKIVTEVPDRPTDGSRRESSSALPENLEVIKDYAATAAPSEIAKNLAPAVSAPTAIATELSQRSAPISASSSTQSATQTDQRETRSNEPDESGVRLQYAFIDSSRSKAAFQQSAIDQPDWLVPAPIRSLASGVASDVTEDSSSTRASLSTEGAHFMDSHWETIGQLSTDPQFVEPDKNAALTPSGKDPNTTPDKHSPVTNEPPTPITQSGGDVFSRKIDPAALTNEDSPIGVQSGQGTYVPDRPTNASMRGIPPTVPVSAELNENFPTVPAPSEIAKTVAPAAGTPTVIATAVSQILAPTSASSNAQFVTKTDQRETRLTQPEASGVRLQYFPDDSSHPMAASQQTAADQHQDLPFSADVEISNKAGENLPGEHQDISTAAARFAAISAAPNAEVHNSADVKSNAWPTQVLHQVTGEIARNIHGKRHEAIMTLDPPELGNLKIGLTIDGDKVQVHILAENRESRELLEKHMPELKQALQIQQLNIVEVRVESGRFGDFSGAPRQGFQPPSQERQQGDGNFGTAFGGENTPVDSRQVSAAQSNAGRVSMWA